MLYLCRSPSLSWRQSRGRALAAVAAPSPLARRFRRRPPRLRLRPRLRRVAHPRRRSAPPPANECLARLKSAGYEIEAAASPVGVNQDCRIDDPVKLRTIPVAGREKPLRMPAEPLVACRFAESLGGWLGSLVAPMVLGATGSQLEAVHTGPGFQCRNRNRLPSGKLSAHAEGWRSISPASNSPTRRRLPSNPMDKTSTSQTINAVRRAACGWFTTVLGPGSDPSHADHLHVDLQVHGSSDRYRICQ